MKEIIKVSPNFVANTENILKDELLEVCGVFVSTIENRVKGVFGSLFEHSKNSLPVIKNEKDYTLDKVLKFIGYGYEINGISNKDLVDIFNYLSALALFKKLKDKEFVLNIKVNHFGLNANEMFEFVLLKQASELIGEVPSDIGNDDELLKDTLERLFKKRGLAQIQNFLDKVNDAYQVENASDSLVYRKFGIELNHKIKTHNKKIDHILSKAEKVNLKRAENYHNLLTKKDSSLYNIVSFLDKEVVLDNTL